MSNLFIAPAPRAPASVAAQQGEVAGEPQLTEQERKKRAKADKEKNRKREQTRARRRKLQEEARCKRNGAASVAAADVQVEQAVTSGRAVAQAPPAARADTDNAQAETSDSAVTPALPDAGALQARAAGAVRRTAADADAGALQARAAGAVRKTPADADTVSVPHTGRGASKRARDEHMRARREMRAQHKLDHKRVKQLQKKAQGLAHLNKADKRGKGTVRFNRQERVVRKLVKIEQAK